MKRTLLIFAFCAFGFACFSQNYDYLVYKDGKKVEVVLSDVGKDFVKYRFPNSSNYRISAKSLFSKIVSKDGKTIYPETDNSTIGNNSVNPEIARQPQRTEFPVEEPTYNNSYNDNLSYQHTEDRLYQHDDRRRYTNRNSDYSSSTNYQEVVYLKNGSIIRGIVIEHIPNSNIKIRTADGSIFVYQTDEVERITKEPVPKQSGSVFGSSYSSNGQGMQTGYKGIIELGYAIGVGDYDLDRFKFHFINGYQFNPFFSLGFGTGFHYYDLYDDQWLIPFFADFRAHFLDNPISPYLSLGVGYSFNASNDFKGEGFLMNPTIGVSFKVARKTAINVGIGYDLQRIKVMDGYSVNCGAFSINAGVSF